MRNIALMLIIGFYPICGCNQPSDVANQRSDMPPIYVDRVYEQDEVYLNSKIDVSLIKELDPWDKDILLRLFVPSAGTNMVYTYKSKYHIPQNIDGTEGVYNEYLILELNPNGGIAEALLYEDGPKQGPLFHSLFRAADPNLNINDLKRTSQLHFVCPYDSFDKNYYGDARIISSDAFNTQDLGEQ